MRYVTIACAVVLAAVFTASAVSKLHSRSAFVAFTASVRAMGLVPATVTTVVAATVASAELVAPIVLLLAPAWGFAWCCGLLAVLSTVILMLIRRGAAISCPCFGGSGNPLGAWHLARNAMLGLTALTGLVVTARPLGQAGRGAGTWALSTVDPAGLTVVTAAALALATLMIGWDDVVALFRPIR